MITTVLFDLDGTLSDPKIGITKSVKYSLAKFGIKAELDELERFIGPPLKESFMKYYEFSDEMAIDAIEKYREYFKDKGIYENELYDGISELLNQLVKNDLALAVATSKPTFFAQKILRYFNIDNYFKEIIGSNLDNTGTEKKDIIKLALSKLNKSNYESIMIGDRRHDIIGAKANNVQSIGVLYGYGSRTELEGVSPEYIVQDIKGLSKLLGEITTI